MKSGCSDSCTAAVVQKVYMEKWLEAIAAEEV